jgi:predicted transport protein
VEKASKSLKKLADTEIIEFQTFVREDAPNVHAHLFEPLYVVEEISEKGTKEKKESWEKRLRWVDDNIKDIVNVLTNRILQLGEITHKPSGEDYCFYKGAPSTKSIFAAFMLRKKALKVGIRTDPKTFKDPKKWTGDKIYKPWFFRQGQERAFKITDKNQIDYAMELIKQSYEISGETKKNRG